jgi:hypothetical protein
MPRERGRADEVRFSLPKSVAYTAILAVATYMFVEAATTLWYLATAARPEAYWVFEESGRTFRFDPIRGYRLSEVPSGVARITRGAVEYASVVRGNNQGFPDRDDFGPERAPGDGRRIAVLGDSFTAAQFLEVNWPDRAEDMLRERGDPTCLLNLAVDGGGIANWWSILTRLVDAEEYDIEGVIFAAYTGDLRRRFSIADHTVGPYANLTRLPGWDPESYPTTLEEALPHLRPNPNAFILSSEEFNRALAFEWLPPRQFRFDLAHRIRLAARRLGQLLSSRETPGDTALPRERTRIFDDDLRELLRRRDLESIVVYLPRKSHLLEEGEADVHYRETVDFAERIGASFIDGAEAFAGLDSADAQDCWFEYDGHWNQRGSDEFARFMTEIIMEGREPQDRPPAGIR